MQTVMFDFDNTLHPYTDGWVGHAPTDEPPIEGAAEFLAELFEAGFRIVISSCRADDQAGVIGIWDWLKKWGLAHYVGDVTHLKPAAEAYIDDRAVSFRGNWDTVRRDVQRLIDGRPKHTLPPQLPGHLDRTIGAAFGIWFEQYAPGVINDQTALFDFGLALADFVQKAAAAE